jgi:hypothetical protein
MNADDAPRRDRLSPVILILVLVAVVVHPTSRAFSLAWLGRLPGLPEEIVEKAPRLTLADIVIWLAGGLLFIRMLVRRDFSVLRTLPAAAVLLVSLATVSMVFAKSRFTAVAEVVQHFEYFLVFYLAAVSVLTTRGRVELALSLWLGVACIAAAWGLAEYLDRSRSAVEVAGPFLNRNVLGGYVAMLAPLCWGLLLHRRAWPTLLQSLALPAAGFVVVLAGGPWMGMAVGVLVVSAVRSRRLLPVVLPAMLVLVVGVYPVLPRNNAEVLAKSLGVFDTDMKTVVRAPSADLVEAARISPRCLEWQACLRSLTPGIHDELGMTRLEHSGRLLVGVGIGNYQQNIGRFYGTLPKPNENTIEPDTHNLYLVMAVSTGVPAALAFLWLVGSFIRRAAAGCRDAHDPFLRGLFLGCIGAMASLLVTNIFTQTLVHGSGPAMILVFALVSAGTRLRDGGTDALVRPGGKE